MLWLIMLISSEENPRYLKIRRHQGNDNSRTLSFSLQLGDATANGRTQACLNTQPWRQQHEAEQVIEDASRPFLASLLFILPQIMGWG